MTQEEKAKRYDEVLEQAKSWYVDAQLDFKKSLETLFPELKKSEDEKTRKAILELVRQSSEVLDKQNQNNMIAWLEKQGGKPQRIISAEAKEAMYSKPAWSEEDEEIFKSLNKLLNEASCYSCTEGADKILSWLKSFKNRVIPQPKQEWSEEDENKINHLIAYFEDKEGFTAEDDIAYANWLKSLKQRIAP